MGNWYDKEGNLIHEDTRSIIWKVLFITLVAVIAGWFMSELFEVMILILVFGFLISLLKSKEGFNPHSKEYERN